MRCPGGAGPICGHGLPSGPVGVGPAVVVGGAVVVVVGGTVVVVVVLDGPAAVRFVSVSPWHPATVTIPTTASTTSDLRIMSSMVAVSTRNEQSRKSLPAFEAPDAPTRTRACVERPYLGAVVRSVGAVDKCPG